MPKDPMAERDALWKKTNAAISAGTWTKANFVEHLKAEAALSKLDPRIDLEAILMQGLKRKLIASVDEGAKLLEGPKA